MTLRNFIDMLSDPTEIGQIYAVNKNGECVCQICYYSESNLTELHASIMEDMKDPRKARILGEDFYDICAEEFQTFQEHLDNEIIKIDLSERDIYVKCCEELWDYDPEDERDPFEI